MLTLLKTNAILKLVRQMSDQMPIGKGWYKKGVQKMKTVKISLNSIDAVKSFVNTVTKYDSDFDLVSGRYVIDAKSIMGIFSLDLSKPIELNIHSEEQLDEILDSLKQFVIE